MNNKHEEFKKQAEKILEATIKKMQPKIEEIGTDKILEALNKKAFKK